MKNLKFLPATESGIVIYISDVTDNISLIQDDSDDKFYIRIKSSDGWTYPLWDYDPFDTLTDAEDWLNGCNWQDATIDNIDTINTESDITEAMKLLGLSQDTLNCNRYSATIKTTTDITIDMNVVWSNGVANICASINGKSIPEYRLPKPSSVISKVICSTEMFLHRYGINVADSDINDYTQNTAISAAINTRNLAQNIVKVKSSNVWGYTINVKNRKDKFGDVIVQFKGENGGPGDMYIYYDVPVLTYRRWHSAPSKGHYFWKYIRNYFKYSKLTGDRKGKLDNAVN